MSQLSAHSNVVPVPRRAEAAAFPGLVAGANLPLDLRRAGLPWTAVALAVGLHAAVLGALFIGPADNLAGSHGQQLDAISVTIVNSNVLQALSEATAPSTPSPAAAPLETEDGSTEASAASRTKAAPADETSPPVPVPDVVAERAPETVDEVSPPDAVPVAKGGTTALALSGDGPPQSSSPAAASPGAIREYARYVSQALAKTRPKGAGRPGTVKVRLNIAPSGKLAGAEITKSSGNTELDETALGAVRRARFPAPPAGMSAAQLTYEVPYHFR